MCAVARNGKVTSVSDSQGLRGRRDDRKAHERRLWGGRLRSLLRVRRQGNGHERARETRDARRNAADADWTRDQRNQRTGFKYCRTVSSPIFLPSS
jgi:hypothetical protein